jgi:hypothetical protein
MKRSQERDFSSLAITLKLQDSNDPDRSNAGAGVGDFVPGVANAEDAVLPNQSEQLFTGWDLALSLCGPTFSP